ncbi:hypothetical protein HMI49_11730 [Corallococcus exercitus]|uniref:Uncharacterized protein n=1 Tax=Corallococcus exercitus TaxID=2316736 RepID=A0A7Y4KID3_9BACT|nr:hypothetical protein [Corallococcus exercitus]NOK33870.1 hypothetical protein [Corallococcus exercitus]
MDASETISLIAACVGGGAGLTGIVVFGIQRTIDSYLKNHLDKELEHYKFQLQLAFSTRLEELKTSLNAQSSKELEKLKSTLSSDNDLVRHELQKQIIKAQLSTTKSHEIIYKIARRIRLAQGRAADLIRLQPIISYEGFSREEMRKVLQSENSPRLETEEVLRIFNLDRDEAVIKIHAIKNRNRIALAYKYCERARGSIALNRVLLGPGLYEQSMSVMKAITSIIMAHEYKDTTNVVGRAIRLEEESERIDEMIQGLEDNMRSELLSDTVARPAD